MDGDSYAVPEISESKRDVINGSVENVIYRNEDNGYTVFEMLLSNDPNEDNVSAANNNRITCTALLPGINEGENLRLTGNFVMHPSYGRQFNAVQAVRGEPTSISGIIKYLASSIKGIGDKTAILITNAFGQKTFEIIEKYPEKLAKIKGITHAKARQISEQFKEQGAKRHIIIKLQELGISVVFAQRIFDRYKENAIDLVTKNPYALADDIIGIGFKTADTIAFRAGFDPASEFRIKAAIRFILSEESQNGHVFLEKNMLVSMAAKLLEIGRDLAENGLMALQLERKIFQEKQDGQVAVYLNKYFYAESYTAKRLLELSFGIETKIEQAILDKDIAVYEKQANISLADEQKRAVKEALNSGVLVITGGPGTGKTTIINAIISLFRKRELVIELAAPTGRAAKRMEEAAGMEAKTIHRLLGMTGGDSFADKTEKNEDNPIGADVIIIDESSMVDISLMYCLLRAIPHGARLILAGDADQLPSVGPGCVLRDIIDSGVINVVKLTEIFRQSRESAIVMNAHRINHGERPALNESGFYLLRRHTAEQAQIALTELVRDRLPGFSGADPMTDIQVLTPMRKSALGVSSLNIILQTALNPPGPDKNEKEHGGYVFRQGDKVMQVKNNYNLAWKAVKPGGGFTEGTGVYNGDMGVISLIDERAELLRVIFDGGRTVDYAFSRLDELEPAYAITIHKSQGSEYKVVVIPVLGGPPQLMTRNLLYTAITRAKELAVIVGTPDSLYRMVDNNRETQRFSALSYRLRKLHAIITGDGSD